MYWNKTYETMPREQLEALQLARLQETVRREYLNVPFYRELMQKANLVPEDIKSLKDLRRLPFMNKTDLRDNYPFGLFAVPMSEIVRVHASSGTTGKPTVVGYTQKDIQMWSECVARCFYCAGAGKGDIVQIAYGYGLFTGGMGLHYGAERIGATTVPISGGNTARQIMLMEDFGATVIACTPSYALMMAEYIEEHGVNRQNLKLKAGIFGAEPWTEEMRQQIEAKLKIKALDIYGLSETMGPGVAIECMEAQSGLHIWEDHFLAEIIDPETGEPLPDGETGELVITTLGKEGFPTIRYRTHDITSFIVEPCICGRTHRRIKRLKGRTDDMLIIRGVNVFPSQIETALMGIEGVAPYYLLVVDRQNNLDILEVQVEMAGDMQFDAVREIEALQRKIKAAVEGTLGISVSITLVGPKTLPRTDGKAKRILDKRKLFD